MRRSLLVLFSALLLSFAPLFSANAQEDLKRELEILKDRVRQLEEKLKEQESKAAQAEEAQKEQRKELSTIVEALKGIEIGFSATGVAQGSVDNDKNEGIPSDRERKDRVDGSISADLEISKGIGDHGLATVILGGAYGDGIDSRIPSWWGINGDAEGEQRVYLKELWYEHELFDGKFVFFKQKTAYEIMPSLVGSEMCIRDSSFGWGEGDADWNELGQRSFFIAEVGIHPSFGKLQGNYRLYGWFRRHHRDEGLSSWGDRIRGISDSKNGWGVGLSLDQALTPNISLFARVGYQDKELYEFAWAWSVGAEVRGGYWGREADALGAAFGMAMISDDYKDFKRIADAEPWYDKDESHLELYYRFQLSDHISISPDIQVIWNAQGDDRFSPVTIIGIRGNLEL